MKKILLLIVLGFAITVIGYSQDSYLRNRWNLKLGYSRFSTGIEIMKPGRNLGMQRTGHYRISTSYGVANFIEAGAYLGYSRFDARILSADNSFYSHSSASAFYYGIETNFQLFPMLIQADDFRFDLYLSTKAGGMYYKAPEAAIPATHNRFDFFIGPGFTFYLSKHIGLFIEVGYYSNEISKEWANLRYGLSAKF